MRKPIDRRAQNRVQNLFIVVLLLSAFFLLSRTGLIGSDTFSRLFSAGSEGSGTADSARISAQMPVRIAVRSGGSCQAWLGETTGGDVFEDLGPLLTEALGSASDGVAVDEKEFRRALENSSVYYDFTSALPLSLLDAWLGGSADAPQEEARALLLSGLQDGSVSLYGWNDESDAFWCWSTTVTKETLTSAMEKHTGEAAEFAFLSGDAYAALAPYTLLSEARQALPELAVSTAAPEENSDTLLSALSFNIHTNSRYTESDGTLVVKQSLRTVRFQTGGTVDYSGAETDASLLQVESAGETPTLQECADAAWDCVSTLVSGRIGDAQLYLLSAEGGTGGNAVIRFGYMLNGYPILFPEGCAAEVTIESGVITAFTVQLRSYTAAEKSTALLPALQAAAAARGEGAEIFAGYYDDGGDTLSPAWLEQ